MEVQGFPNSGEIGFPSVCFSVRSEFTSHRHESNLAKRLKKKREKERRSRKKRKEKPLT